MHAHFVVCDQSQFRLERILGTIRTLGRNPKDISLHLSIGDRVIRTSTCLSFRQFAVFVHLDVGMADGSNELVSLETNRHRDERVAVEIAFPNSDELLRIRRRC